MTEHRLFPDWCLARAASSMEPRVKAEAASAITGMHILLAAALFSASSRMGAVDRPSASCTTFRVSTVPCLTQASRCPPTGPFTALPRRVAPRATALCTNLLLLQVHSGLLPCSMVSAQSHRMVALQLAVYLGQRWEPLRRHNIWG